jgi:hypothetical protein
MIGMPLMMVVMMRRSHDSAPHQADADETARLRAEVQQLRDEVSQHDDAVA